MTQTFFSEIESVLISNISRAEVSIKIAVAWFTNSRLLNLLLTKQKEGVNVKLIIRDDYINNSTSSLPWAGLYNEGGKINFSDTGKLLHHKYCVIDDAIVITGSYNWTNQAELANQENVVVISEQQIAEAFISNFEALESSSRKVSDVSFLNIRPVAEAPFDEKQFLEDEIIESNKTSNADAIMDEAASFYLKKEYSSAISLLKSSWDGLYKLPEAYEILAWSLARNGQGEDALMYAEKGMALDDKNPELPNAIGYVYDANHQYVKAIEYFDKAINLAPHLTPYYWNKILSLRSGGSTSKAEKVALNLIKAASDILREKEKHTSFDRMHAYIDRGNAKSDSVSRAEDGKKAKKIYDILPANQKDLHDLDSINHLLNRK